MANIKSALKRAKQNTARTLHNKSIKTRIKSQLKQVRHLIEEKEVEEAKAQFHKLQAYLDKAAKTNVIHENAARRHKAHLSRVLAKLEAA